MGEHANAPPEVLAACRKLKIEPGALWRFKVLRGRHVILILANGEEFTVAWVDLPASGTQAPGDLPARETTIPQ